VTTLAVQRDDLMPRPPGGMGRGLMFAIVAHVLLVLALTLSVNWHSSEPAGVEAELWSATPQFAAPKAAEPPPPEPVRPKPPEPRPVEPPPAKVAPPPTADAQIAIEQAKREEKRREQLRAQQEEEQRRKKEFAAKEAEKAEKLAQQRKQDQEAKLKKQAEDQKAAAAREAYLKRMMGQADATGGPTATGTAARTSGPSASYLGRIIARIRSNMSFPDLLQGNPGVEVAITLAPDGTIMSKRIVKASGAPEWDDAVMRALDKTAVLPRDIDGRIPPAMTIVYHLRD
jgi:colicin import membrane protein